MTNNYIIDTNILIVANDAASHVNQQDVNKCKYFVMGLFKNTIISIDSSNMIVGEYFNYTTRKGEPGLGDALAKHIWDHLYNINICELVNIEKCEQPYLFSIFKQNSELLAMDKDDLKFIAVSILSQNKPIICNACDSDWKENEVVLKKYGINVKEILN